MKTITEKTLIPISLVLTIAGGSSWLSAVKSQLDEATISVQKMESKLDNLAVMRTDIEVIKTKLEGMQRPPIRSAQNCPYNPALFSMIEKSQTQGE